MHTQSLIVAVVVCFSFVYAAWTMMPSSWRRALAGFLSRWPLLARRAAIQKALRPASACGGCDSCDKVDKGRNTALPDQTQPVRIVPGRWR